MGSGASFVLLGFRDICLRAAEKAVVIHDGCIVAEFKELNNTHSIHGFQSDWTYRTN
jgi:hypothetical protein